MSLSGQFATMPLGDLLQWVHLGRKAGTLQVELSDCRKMVYLQHGRVFFASSTKENERLGRFLVRHEHITAAELEQCLRFWHDQKGAAKLSEIVVARGLMTNEQMLKRLGELVQEIVYDLFLYEDGYFEFQEGYLPPQVTQSFQLDSQWLMFEGLRRLDEFRRNAQQMPAADQVLERTGAADHRLCELDKDADVLYSLVDGRRDVEAILHAGPLSAYDAQIQLMNLLMNNLVTLKVMDERELHERRVGRLLERGGALLAQGETARARELLDECDAGTLQSESRLRELESRVNQALYAEVDRLTGGPDKPLMVDPSALRAQRDDPVSADQGFVLSRIGERATLREVVHTSGFGKSRTYYLMLTLLRAGLICRVDTGLSIEPLNRDSTGRERGPRRAL